MKLDRFTLKTTLTTDVSAFSMKREETRVSVMEPSKDGDWVRFSDLDLESIRAQIIAEHTEQLLEKLKDFLK